MEKQRQRLDVIEAVDMDYKDFKSAWHEPLRRPYYGEFTLRDLSTILKRDQTYRPERR